MALSPYTRQGGDSRGTPQECSFGHDGWRAVCLKGSCWWIREQSTLTIGGLGKGVAFQGAPASRMWIA
jgi:hypothetical protein